MPHRSRLLPVLTVTMVSLIAVQLSLGIAGSSPGYEWFDPIVDVRRILLDGHLQSPDQDDMQQAAIAAMVESLDDPYSIWVPDDHEGSFTKDLEGDYVGIGAEIRVIDDELTIISPMPNSPALESGIKAGDRVLMIDGEPTAQQPIASLIDKLVGIPGTVVSVQVRHLDGAIQEIDITRNRIQTNTVLGLLRRGGAWQWCIDAEAGIMYARIRQFTDTTLDELASTIQSVEETHDIAAIVLDLRDNPGGTLHAAIGISDMFLESGTIVSVEGRNAQRRSWKATPRRLAADAELLVLVNGNSASAAEIVAGSLQGNGRAAVLGTRSYGKGSVQEVRELPSGGMLKFTTGRYDLPGGRTIDRSLTDEEGVWGVDPDPGLVVRESIEQTLARFKAREPFTIITDQEPEGPDCGDETWIRQTLQDEQLASAVDALRHKLDSGDWPILNDEPPMAAALQDEVRMLSERREKIIDALDEVDERLAVLNGTTSAETDDQP